MEEIPVSNVFTDNIPSKDFRIRGEKVILRPIQPSDTDNALLWRNDPEVVKNYIYRKPVTKEDHENWLENQVNKGLVHQFIITVIETGEDIGSVYIQHYEPDNNKAESGIYMGSNSSSYGHGYGSEAVILIKEYAFNILKLHKLIARVLSYNVASKRLHEKAGYQEEACLKEELFIDGKYHDLLLYGVINEN